MAESDPRQAAIGHLWRTAGAGGQRAPYLHCILDAAQDPGIYEKLREFAADAQIVSLYQGQAAQELAGVAPYLVSLGMGTDLFDWIWEEGWGKSWGIFFWSVQAQEGLLAHFRKLTKVRTDDGTFLLFRFYDPRVLSLFLPTCDAAQIREFFGTISHFYSETSDGSGIEEFTQSQGNLRRRVLSLEGPRE